MARCVAFGYKRQDPPIEATLVLDVRSITNPYQKGRSDESSRRMVLKHPLAESFIQQGVSHLLSDPDAFVAVGCSWGQHRSVAIAKAIWSRYRKERGNA